MEDPPLWRNVMYVSSVTVGNLPANRLIVIYMKFHTVKKIYVCKQCGKGFAEKSTFYKQKNSYWGEILYT